MLPDPARDGRPMNRLRLRKLPFFLGSSLLAATLLSPLHAQLVRENVASPSPQVAPTQQSPDSTSDQTPTCKNGLSHDVPLTCDESVFTTALDVQLGHPVL